MIEELENALTWQKKSACGKYRYSFKSVWENAKTQAMFIFLHPTDNSDAEHKAMELAHFWGYGGVTVCWLFGLICKDAKSMKATEEPVGEYTDQFIKNEAKKHGLIVAAWGTHGTHKERYKDVLGILKNYNISCVKKSTKGFPSELGNLEIADEPILFKKVGTWESLEMGTVDLTKGTVVIKNSVNVEGESIPFKEKKKAKKKSTGKKRSKKK